MNNPRILALPCALPCLSNQKLRALEQQAQQTLPPGTLMERAGQAAAQLVRQLAFSSATRVNILAGPGNNGGDGFVLARILQNWGYRVRVYCNADISQLPTDAYAAYQAWQQSGGCLATNLAPLHLNQPEATAQAMEAADIWIDALFGIGLSRPLTGIAAEWVHQANQATGLKIALDIPSGLASDTGHIVGGDTAACFCADHTITFLAHKPGLYMNCGPQFAGQVHLATLTDANTNTQASALHCNGYLNHPHLFLPALPKRLVNAHKGNFGRLALIGGQTNLQGALLLAARSALYSGAGRIYMAFLGEAPAGLPNPSNTQSNNQPELMLTPLRDIIEGAQALWQQAEHRPHACVIGPGMGQSTQARRVLEQVLRYAQHIAMVFDADALNLLSTEGLANDSHISPQNNVNNYISAIKTRWQSAIQATQSINTILTPHPLEAARLLGVSVEEIQAERITAALTIAQQYRAITILKGNGTVLAHPDARYVINPTGCAALATAGTGDILAGLIGSLLAQGMPAWEASLAAVWLHGKAGEQFMQQHGVIGMAAGELPALIRQALNQLSRAQ